MLRKLLVPVALIAFSTIAFADSAVVVVTKIPGFDIPGGNISGQPMPNADYCRALCITNRCNGYTFAQQGAQGMCYLKSELATQSAPVRNPNTVSGYRVTILLAFDNTDFSGGVQTY